MWHDSELIVVAGGGHAGSDPGMTETVVDALNRFAVAH
jgi:hypothetical protein